MYNDREDGINETGPRSGPCFVLLKLNPGNDIAEDVADRGPEESEDDDDDNGDEYEDQRVLNQTLAFFFRSE
jgi:hypothetical protein